LKSILVGLDGSRKSVPQEGLPQAFCTAVLLRVGVKDLLEDLEDVLVEFPLQRASMEGRITS